MLGLAGQLGSFHPLSLSLNSFYFPEQKISKKKRRRKEVLGIEFACGVNFPWLIKMRWIQEKIKVAWSNNYRKRMNIFM